MDERQNDRRSLIMLAASLAIVGTIGFFRRSIAVSSPMLAFFRGLIGAAALVPVAALRRGGRGRRPGPRQIAGLAVNGACIGINWILLFEAYNYTTVARATLSYYMQPTLLMLLSPLVFGEKLTRRKLACALAALMGMALVSGVLEEAGGGARELKGIALGLGAACFYTLVIILNKKISGVDVYWKTVIQLFSAAAALTPYLIWTGGFAALAPDARTVALILVVGLIHTAFAYALYFGSMDGLRAQTISALGYIDPVVAMFVSAALLREPLTGAALAGAALILGAAVVSERKAGTDAGGK